tara:strand:- start:310 stop:1707 length:1398 start_codon:yes stop_codon:yes gene_type:complete
MAGIQYAGEYEIEEIKLFSSSGNIIPLDGLMMQLTLFENIFSPTMSGQITLLDTNSIVLNLPIIGQEYLSFKIKTASLGSEGTDIIDYTENIFSVYKIDKRIMADSAEAIVLHFTSPEMMRNNRTRVSKSYTNSIDKIVIDVLQNERYLNSKKDLFIEGTVGVRKMIAPNNQPFTFIQKLASESISLEHSSPYFMFYENKDGIHFRSLESLYNQPIIAKYNTGDFVNQGSGGTVVRNVLEEYSRPLSHQIVQANDMLSNVKGGLLGSNLITYDIYKKSYNKKSFRYFQNFRDYGRISDNPIYNTNVIDEFGNTVDNFTDANIHLHPTSKVEENDAQYFTDVATSPYSPNRIENGLLHRQAKLLELKKGVSLIVEVHGLTNIAIGQTINFEMQVVGETHGKSKADPYYSGKYLITTLRHNFSVVPSRNHTIIMTIVKDGYNEELEQNTGASEPKRLSKGRVFTNVA